MWDQSLYQKAIDFAARCHGGQLVPGRNYTYIVHLSNVAMEVCRALFEEKLDKPDLAIQCALLHDVLEDTKTPENIIKETFGNEVLTGIKALTKNKMLDAKIQLTDSLNRIISCGKEIAWVKLADRITNLQVPPNNWSKEKINSYYDESLKIYKILSVYGNYLGNRLKEQMDFYRQFCQD